MCENRRQKKASTSMPAEKSSARNRGFTFTVNNYSDRDIESIKALDCKYAVVGYEVAPSTGTKHLQGYVYWQNAKTFTATKRLLPKGCHIEVARGSADDNYEYCTKTGKHLVKDAPVQEFFEVGTRPMSQKEKGQRGAEFWDSQKDLIEQGKVDQVDSKVLITHYGNVQKMAAAAATKRKLTNSNELAIWYYGPPGCGKSHYVREQYPDAYIKLSDVKWWDHYEQGVHDTVIIEDFHPTKASLELLGQMKHWTDKYPFPVEIKNHVIKIRPKLVVITSNFHPLDIWPSEDLVLPLLRRLRIIKVTTQNGGFWSLRNPSVFTEEVNEERDRMLADSQQAEQQQQQNKAAMVTSDEEDEPEL